MAMPRTAIVGGNPIWIMLIASLVSQSSIVNADDAIPIEWREAIVTVDVDLREIEGHEGHAVGLMQQRGFAFFKDDEVATVNAWLTFERSGAETSYRGYAVYAFPDGATKIGRFSGRGFPPHGDIYLDVSGTYSIR